MNQEHGVFVIQLTEPEQCELCGTVAECRPYGPNGEAICFECGMKTPEVTKAQMAKVMGEPRSQALLAVYAQEQAERTKFQSALQRVVGLLEQADALIEKDRRAAFALTEEAAKLEYIELETELAFLFQNKHELVDDQGNFKEGVHR